MKKQDLTEEYTVVYRNGEFREFSNGEFFDGRRKVNNITNYSDDLRHFASDKIDIVEVKNAELKTIWIRDFDKYKLESGDLCELKNGLELYLEKERFIINTDGKVINLHQYNEDLKISILTSSGYDIMSVKRDGITIWTREESKTEAKQQTESKDNEESSSCNLHSKYQRFFDFMNQEHDLMLMVEQMDEIIHEASLFLKENDQDDIYTDPKTINAISLLMMLPESVQLEIVRAMSEEQKLKLIGL